MPYIYPPAAILKRVGPFASRGVKRCPHASQGTLGAICKHTLGVAPSRMPVTTRIITFLGSGIPIQLYLSLASWEGATPNIYSIVFQYVPIWTQVNIEKRAPGCLGDLLGMNSYPIMWGIN